MGQITIGANFQNVFEVYSFSQATFVFWSELNSSEEETSSAGAEISDGPHKGGP